MNFFSCDARSMPNKRKAVGTTAAAVPPKVGGSGRGQGRKPTAVNTPGVDAADTPKRKQQSLGELLGERFQKKQLAAGPEPDAAARGGDMLDWQYVLHIGDGEDTLVNQEQYAGGRVQYDMEKEAVTSAHLKGA